MLQAAFNTLRDRADVSISTPLLHFYRVTLPIIAFHVVMEYGPKTPDPFPRRTSGHAHQHGEKGLARETKSTHGLRPTGNLGSLLANGPFPGATNFDILETAYDQGRSHQI